MSNIGTCYKWRGLQNFNYICLDLKLSKDKFLFFYFNGKIEQANGNFASQSHMWLNLNE